VKEFERGPRGSIIQCRGGCHRCMKARDGKPVLSSAGGCRESQGAGVKKKKENTSGGKERLRRRNHSGRLDGPHEKGQRRKKKKASGETDESKGSREVVWDDNNMRDALKKGMTSRIYYHHKNELKSKREKGASASGRAERPWDRKKSRAPRLDERKRMGNSP